MVSKQQQENDIVKHIEHITDYLGSSYRNNNEVFPPPFFIEFTGSPASGKSTTIRKLDTLLRHHGLCVLTPQEGAEAIRHIPRTTPLYNIRTGLYALEKLIDLSYGHQYDVVIFDRCIFDAYCWMMYWNEKGLLGDDELKFFQSFFLSSFWAQKIDIAFFMICDSKIAIKREHRIRLGTKPGDTTTPEKIRALIGRYKKAFEILLPTYPQLRMIDTTKLDEQAMIEYVAEQTFKMFEQKIQRELAS